MASGRRGLPAICCIILAVVVGCSEEPPPVETPASSLIGHWRFAYALAVDTSVVPWDTVNMCPRPDTVHNPPIPRLDVPDLVITPDWLYTHYETQTVLCDKVQSFYYTVRGDEVVKHTYVATFLTMDETLDMTLSFDDTLVYRGRPWAFCSMGPAYGPFVFSRLTDGLEQTVCTPFVPPPPITMPDCTDYGCDSTLPLVLAFYDGTPSDTTDAGVFVGPCALSVNGRPIVWTGTSGLWHRRVFIGDPDHVLLPRQVPIASGIKGYGPLYVQFYLARDRWCFADSTPSQNVLIDSITVRFGVAGNYRVSVLTGEQDVGASYDAGLPFTEIIREAAVVAMSPSHCTTTASGFDSWVEERNWMGDFEEQIGRQNADTLVYVWYRRATP